MDFSIIFPVYNEEHKILTDIRSAAIFLRTAFEKSEIIVVDDGSTDNTLEIAQQMQVENGIELVIKTYEPNKGKGHAVKTGVLASRGKHIMFADSGRCTPFEYAHIGLDMIKAGTCELAHGSRKLEDSIIEQPHLPFRQFTSKLVPGILKFFMRVPKHLTDTQCGFKIYKGDVARELYEELYDDGFLFDIEIIKRAVRKGYRISEFPIRWTADLDTRLKAHGMIFRMFFEMMAIQRALRKSK